MLIDVEALARAFLTKGDLAHLALLAWALCTTALLGLTLRELAAANRRFNDFVSLLSAFFRALGE
jgi:hypothetical protein